MPVPFWMLGGELAHPVECESSLRVEGMLDPERSILIEGGDAILGLDVVGIRLVGHFLNEGNDRLLRPPVVPGRKRRGLSVGLDSQQYCVEHKTPHSMTSEAMGLTLHLDIRTLPVVLSMLNIQKADTSSCKIIAPIPTRAA